MARIYNLRPRTDASRQQSASPPAASKSSPSSTSQGTARTSLTPAGTLVKPERSLRAPTRAASNGAVVFGHELRRAATPARRSATVEVDSADVSSVTRPVPARSHYIYIHGHDGSVTRDLMTRVQPSSEPTPTASASGKIYEKSGCSVELVLRMPPTTKEEETTWLANNPTYADLRAQRVRGKDVRIFVADTTKEAQNEHALMGVAHCLTAIQEANTLVVLLLNRPEGSHGSESATVLKKTCVELLAAKGVLRLVAEQRLRVHVVNTITGEKVDSTFRDIARELRGDAMALAKQELESMDVDARE